MKNTRLKKRRLSRGEIISFSLLWSKSAESAFCEWFAYKHELMFAGSQFFDIDGILSEERLSKEILEDIESYIKSNLSNRVRKLVEVLKLKNMAESLPMQEVRVHFHNGTYFLEGGFIPEKEFCANRFPVDYVADAKEPKQWLGFLEQLLYEEDIPRWS